jgi:hypothetical protein
LASGMEFIWRAYMMLWGGEVTVVYTNDWASSAMVYVVQLPKLPAGAAGGAAGIGIPLPRAQAHAAHSCYAYSGHAPQALPPERGKRVGQFRCGQVTCAPGADHAGGVLVLAAKGLVRTLVAGDAAASGSGRAAVGLQEL